MMTFGLVYICQKIPLMLQTTQIPTKLAPAVLKARQKKIKNHRMSSIRGGIIMERAIFAGGCFWCMIQPFDTLPGIHTVMSGYTGGHVPDPTYEQVKSQTTGHTEAVEIIYDPTLISYEQLVELYWQQTDPTDAFGQFEDRGDNYRPRIQSTIKDIHFAVVHIGNHF